MKKTARTQEQERALIAKAQKGDKEAAAKILAAYRPLILAAGRGRRAQRFQEDATQEAAAELLRTIRAYDLSRGAPFAAYAKPRVYGAVSHLLRRYQRKWDHECALQEAEDLDTLAASGRAGDAPAILDRLALRPLLAKLPEDQQSILALLYHEQKTLKETAQLLGCAPSTIARKKAAALKYLKTRLEQ